MDDHYYWLNSDIGYHREDGPAIIYPDGRQEWWIAGKQYIHDDYVKINKLFLYWIKFKLLIEQINMRMKYLKYKWKLRKAK